MHRYLLSHNEQLRSNGSIEKLQKMLVDAQFITPDVMVCLAHSLGSFHELVSVSLQLSGPESLAH